MVPPFPHTNKLSIPNCNSQSELTLIIYDHYNCIYSLCQIEYINLTLNFNKTNFIKFFINNKIYIYLVIKQTKVVATTEFFGLQN